MKNVRHEFIFADPRSSHNLDSFIETWQNVMSENHSEPVLIYVKLHKVTLCALVKNLSSATESDHNPLPVSMTCCSYRHLIKQQNVS